MDLLDNHIIRANQQGDQPPVDQQINSSPPGENGRHFADNIFRCIFVNENFCILIKISLKFVPKGPIDKTPHWFRYWLGTE